MRRCVTLGASSASPSATTRMPVTRSSAGVRLSRNPLAPALSASYTYSSRSNVVRMTTRELSSRSSATISRVASMPFITGICTSMSTTSGSRRRVSVTASAPLPASPTTSMSSSDSRISRRPERTSCSSSASTTLTVMSPPFPR